MSGFDGLAFARLFRSSCCVCGSGRLVWGSVGDEVARLVESGEDPNEWLSQVTRGVGVDVGSELLALDAWRCGDCGEVGVFGRIEVGP